jgi:FAD/FMN-containing dehydrogenase
MWRAPYEPPVRGMAQLRGRDRWRTIQRQSRSRERNVSRHAGTRERPDAYFINLDLIGFVPATPSEQYPAQLWQFFADVERDWVAMGGFPHNGKMYGFYDPNAGPGTHTGAFNTSFLAALRTRRGERLQTFNTYRQSQDPTGLFYNEYLRRLLEG